MRRSLLFGAAVAAAVLAVVVPAGVASAHPLGNVTVNTYAGVVVGAARTTVDYVLDLAELPTVQARQRIDTDGDGQVSPAEGAAYRTDECGSIARGLELVASGRVLPLRVEQATLAFPPGQAGLATLRLECSIEGELALDGTTEVGFVDRNFTDRLGWREVTLNGDGVTLRSASAPAASTSNRLLAYPEGGEVVRVLEAQASAAPGGPRLAPQTATPASEGPQARGTDGLTQTLGGIVGGRELGVAAGALAVAIALLLGGLHSLAPGHGKSLMAAAVVGRRGTGRQVLGIGATVAVTHTTGVLVLGAALWLSQALAPDRLLPWLTAASGALLVLAGVTLLVRRLAGRGGHHGHHHHGLDHHDHHDHHHDEAPSRRWLVAMGMAGGLVPTPSALVVLLGATALGRAWFGVVLVGAYGVGMALTLLGAGLLLVRIQGWLEARFLQRPWWSTLLRIAPVVTAALLVGSGLLITLRGLATT